MQQARRRWSSWSSSGRSMTATDSANQEMMCSPEGPQSNIYHSVDDLPFVLFEDCLLNDRLSSLIRSRYKIVQQERQYYKPEVPDYELQQAWMNIYSQYCERLGDNNLMHATRVMGGIHVYDSKIQRVTTIIQCLRQWYDVRQAEMLERALPGAKVDHSSLEAYEKSLSRAESLLKKDIIARDTLVQEYQDLQKKAASGSRMTGEYFTEMLVHVSKHEGYHVRKKDITVGEYCAYVKTYRNHIETELLKRKRK
ncbi:MAG TPA: hypothetical protein VIM64_11505 [Puia sp.]